MRTCAPFAILLSSLVVGVATLGADPHVHGKGRLALAPTADRIQLELVLPAADVWGFEQAPGTEEETARQEKGLRDVRDALAGVVSLPEALGCTLDSSEVTTSESEEDRESDTHSDTEGDHHEHEEHHQDSRDGGETAEHREVRATATWSCRRSPLGSDIEVRRPESMQHLETIEIWVLGPSGQTTTVLRADTVTVRLQ